MKKKILGMIVLTTMLVSLLAACGTKEDNTGTGGADTSQGDNTIIVGTEAGFAPFEYMEGNSVVGVDMDIAKAIADSLGKELVIKNMDFDSALLAVQNGTVDFVAAGVSVTEERLEVMDFTNDYAESIVVVVVNKNNPAVSSIEDLNGKIIGVQQGNVADFYIEDEVKAKEIKRYTKFAQASEDLKNEKIDCIVMDKAPAEELVASNKNLVILADADGNGSILFEDKFAIAVKKGNSDLLNQINAVIQKLKDEGKIEEFFDKHISK